MSKQIVLGFQNLPGITGPDSAVIQLADGRVIEVGDEGLNVFANVISYVEGLEPVASLYFPEAVPMCDRTHGSEVRG